MLILFFLELPAVLLACDGMEFWVADIGNIATIGFGCGACGFRCRFAPSALKCFDVSINGEVVVPAAETGNEKPDNSSSTLEEEKDKDPPTRHSLSSNFSGRGGVSGMGVGCGRHSVGASTSPKLGLSSSIETGSGSSCEYGWS